MSLKIFQVDAFTHQPFSGNPAGVCILPDWLPDVLMQAIAAEMNLAETAFLVAKEDGFRIRWFTPMTEVKLCGHATLAAAHVLFEHYNFVGATIRFRSLSGQLLATKQDSGRISLDFPANPLESVPLSHEMSQALGGDPLFALADDDLVLVYSDATEISLLEPDIPAIAALPYRGVCATAPGNGNGVDFVARFFAPAVGVDEDFVTGSLYTELAPYYSERFGKTELTARQVSKRSGDLWLRHIGKRVHIAGYAVTVLTAEMHLPAD